MELTEKNLPVYVFITCFLADLVTHKKVGLIEVFFFKKSNIVFFFSKIFTTK